MKISRHLFLPLVIILTIVEGFCQSDLFSIENNGNVGIGVLAPQTTLDIRSQGNNWFDGGIALSDDLSNRFFIYKDLANHLHIGYNGGKALTLFFGNFGIGTEEPQRKLHVKDVMRLEPRTDAPERPMEGDIYMDSNTHKLMVHDGTTWQACW